MAPQLQMEWNCATQSKNSFYYTFDYKIPVLPRQQLLLLFRCDFCFSHPTTHRNLDC